MGAADCPFVSAKEKLVKMAVEAGCGPDETECTGGCCPEANWYCCPDGMYCAATAADCPFVAAKEKLVKMAAKAGCGPDETECPGGCCPEANWYCCPDGMYCAATAADCPFVAKKTQLSKMAAPKQCDGLLALEAAAPMLAGTAALMACTALPPPLTVHLLSIISISLLPSTIKKN